MTVQTIISSSPSVKPSLVGKNFGIRLLALIIDSVAIYAMQFALSFLTSIFFTIGMTSNIARDSDPQTASLISIPISIVISLLYFTLFEGLYGATPGKLIFGMRVVTEKGDPCSISQALVRGLFRYIDGLFFGIVAAIRMKPPLRQRIGDHVASTVVVGVHESQIISRPWWHFILPMIPITIIAFIGAISIQILSSSVAIPRFTASELNLKQDDLEPGFVLTQEPTPQANSLKRAKDANTRTFIDGGVTVKSELTIYPHYDYESLMSFRTSVADGMADSIQNDFPSEIIAVNSSNLDAPAGEWGGMIAFTRGKTNDEGYLAYFTRGDILVRLFVVGGANDGIPVRARILARALDQRLKMTLGN